MEQKEFVSLFKKAEVAEVVLQKKSKAFIIACIYSLIAIISSFSIYYLRLKPFQLLLQFGYFGNVSEMFTVLSFMVLPILLPVLFYSLSSNKPKYRLAVGGLIAIVFITRISSILVYFSNVYNPNELSLTKPDTLSLITIFIFLICFILLFVGIMCYVANNIKMASLLLKVGAIIYLLINLFFVFGFAILFLAKMENYKIYSMVVYSLDMISSIFILVFVKKLNLKIGNDYLLNK